MSSRSFSIASARVRASATAAQLSLTRLAGIRGIGDPVAAQYARAFLTSKALEIAPFCPPEQVRLRRLSAARVCSVR